MSAVLEAREPSSRYLVDFEPPLLRQFDRLATAPTGVARLRELILSFAVRGQLLGGHVFGLAGGENGEDLPCALPQGWQWIQLSHLGQFRGGKTPSTQRADYWNGSIPWITPKDMKQLRLSGSQDHVTSRALEDGLALIPPGSLLVVVRSGILRRAVPVAINDVETTINQDLKALVLTDRDLGPYLQLLVRGFEGFILERLTKVGTTVESIQFDAFASQRFPLPPKDERARIVARVDELMRLCDALEEKGRLEAEQHARLLSTLLGTLTDSTTPEELAASWHRVAEHFDLLLDRPEAVDAFEWVVVQLAVHGLLTTQSATDEPAVEFVSRVNAGRTARRASTAVTPLASVDQEGLPGGWCLTNVGSVAECLDYLRRPVKKSDREAHAADVPYFGANGQVGWIGEHLFDEDLVLVVEDETFIGRTKPFSYVVRGKSWVNNHAHVLRPLGGMSAEYLNLCLQRYDFVPLTSGTTNRRKLTQPGLLNAEFMLAPLAEQARIVARVTELRRLCTTLRERLQAQQATQSRLAEALVEQALA